MHFGALDSTAPIDIDYTEDVEYLFMNALIDSAYRNNLI
ncbi:hypothetical protein AC88_0299 [Escherichia coli 3-267-03_S4_C1]|nr:hypothetical protein AC88_0299 [Escherichia coli 3-267-03_S4_C1]